MSQPKVYGPKEQDPLAHPIKDASQLLEIFFGAEREKKNWLIGIEYEVFGQINDGTTPLPYTGATSIASLFNELLRKSQQSADPFTPIYEHSQLVALSNKRATIALEPGGQIELAALPFGNLSQMRQNFKAMMNEIEEVASSMNIDLFALGLHPLAKKDQMAKVEKTRYNIMGNYMGGLSGLGLDMMTRSSAIQINLDFADEKDMVEKTRLSAMLVPFYALLCSSSAFIEGKKTTYAVERGHIWRNTDKDRTGIPPVIFEDHFGYEAWIDLALQVPMYFIRRDNVYHDVAGASFRDFMKYGLKGQRALVRDFVDHLSTIFTEVRLKPILELRSADSLPLVFVDALAALSWVLFYDDEAKSRALKLFEPLNHQELVQFHNDVIDRGRKAKFRGLEAYDVIQKLLALAEDALKDLAKKTKDPKLAGLLSPFIKLVEHNTTVAEWIRHHFETLDQTNILKLIKHFAPSITEKALMSALNSKR